MIEEFSVSNFLSINTKQTLSFRANNRERKYHELSTFQIGKNTNLLKFMVLYGPNASGKTNILNALAFLQTIVTDTDKKDKDDKTGFIPFLFDKKTSFSPGEFNLIFYVNLNKFEYRIKLDRNIIISENLFEYNKKKKNEIFSRNFDFSARNTQLSFSDSIDLSEEERLFLKANTLSNTSVIAAYNTTNVSSDLLKGIYEFFDSKMLPMITPTTDLIDWTGERIIKEDSCKGFLIDFLKQADFNVGNIDVKEENYKIGPKDIEKLIKLGAPAEVIDQAKAEKSIKIKNFNLIHNTSLGETPLKFELESRGTTRYFGLGGVLEKMLSNNHFLFVDELESSLHPDLVSHFIKTFLMNTNQSQLLITTHNLSLLETEFLRRDMVWFCEKDKMGQSEYYCATDFNLHHNISLAKFYKTGKLGAIPNLGSILIDRGNQEKHD